ncbi:MAG: DEAD/DEAH box helicase family protein [Actinomycetia bacterium]|nr:DEAD/DEAH box helicase family protein [Actinomycetes bacterium]MCP4086473.1 DEAD/DEAH box helicase family protein [Actinomycetes bacterium]
MSSSSDFLSVSEAASYLGVSAETLRRWDRNGKLVAIRRPDSKRRYYALQDLAAFHLDYARAETRPDSRASVFVAAIGDIEQNDRLRDPQREAHRAVREHFADSSEAAMLVIPVGCGKTGLISVLPFGISAGRVLVIAPNLTIRDGIAEALDIASTECFWTKTRVLSNFQQGPHMAVLDGKDANLHDCAESDFVVTNIQQLASSADRWLPQFPPDFFDMIIVDEGHHSAAESWRKTLRRFPSAKVVSLTATPFRTDRQELPGEIVYRYSFARAMLMGYIKQIRSRSAAPSELYFTVTGEDKRYTFDEVLALSEEAWFRKSVALSPECNRHIVEASIAECNQMRQRTGTHHQIIASACSIDHARQVRSIYQECGYRAEAISSDLDPDKQERILRRLRDHDIDCIVQVQMLGEGFDHPALSVAAIFRPYRSLAPYIQFVGRVMRVIHQNNADHPDNRGVIVSHVGLNNEQRWTDFRELDLDDQDLVRAWTEGENGEARDGENDGGGEPRRFDQLPLVDSEIISHFLDRTYLDPSDDRVLDEILSHEIIPGVTLESVVGDREAFRAALIERQQQQEPEPTYASIPVSPQRRRQEARRRLAERSQSVAARLLVDLGLGANGRQLSKAAGKGHQPNRQAAIALVHERVNDFIGIDPGMRGDISGDQAAAALEQLDLLADEIVAEYEPILKGDS